MASDVRATGTPVVVDPPRRRVRSAVDAGRFAGLILALLVLLGFGTSATRTSAGLNEDLTTAVRDLPGVIADVLSVVGTVGALVFPIVVVIRLLVIGRGHVLLRALAIGAVATAVVWALSLLVDHLPHHALYMALTLGRAANATSPLDPYLAAVVAFGIASGVATEERWRPWYLVTIGVYAVSAFAAAQASVLTLVASLTLGPTVAVGARWIAGRTPSLPAGTRILACLADRGLAVTDLVAGEAARARDVAYTGRTLDGRRLRIIVIDRDVVTTGSVYRAYRSLRVRRDVARAPDLSMERVAERRVALELAAGRVSSAVPALIAGVACGEDAIVLVYERRDGTALTGMSQPVADPVITEIWQQGEALHRARIAHPGLTPHRITVSDEGVVSFPELVDGSLFANDLRISLDRAQLLATTAQVAGVQTAVRIARQVVGETGLVNAVAVLQPVALARETRAYLKSNGTTLDEIRHEIETQTRAPLPELSKLDRFRPRTVVTLVALIVAAWILIGQLGSLDLLTVLRTADWRWVPALLIASFLTYVAAGFSLGAYVREKLPFVRTVVAQFAASFTGFVMPPAVGGIAVNVQYLRREGVPTASAAVGVGMNQLLNSVSHIALLIVVAAVSGTSAEHRLPVPGWVFIALGGVVALAALALTLPKVRAWAGTRLLTPLREALPRVLDLVVHPLLLLRAVGSAVALNVFYIAALSAAIAAFHGNLPIVTIALIYLTAGAIGSLAPTPGGLGAVEAALSAGITAAGMPGAAAISAVLLYRIATFWLPVPVGYASWHWLQRRGAL